MSKELTKSEVVAMENVRGAWEKFVNVAHFPAKLLKEITKNATMEKPVSVGHRVFFKCIDYTGIPEEFVTSLGRLLCEVEDIEATLERIEARMDELTAKKGGRA